MVQGSQYKEEFEYKGLKVELQHNNLFFKRLDILKDGRLVYCEDVSIPCWAYFRYRPKLERQIDGLIQSKLMTTYMTTTSCKV